MRNRYYLMLDVPLIWIAALAAFILRFDLRFEAYRKECFFFLAAATCVKPAVFVLSGVYRRYWRYASISDVAVLVVAAFTSSVMMALVLVIGLWSGLLDTFSRSVVMMDGILTLLLVSGCRVAARVVAESHQRSLRDISAPTRRVLIAGAGEAGVIVARDLQRNPHLGLAVVGFIDDDGAKIGKRIGGFPVLGRIADLSKVASQYQFDEVVIAMPSAPGTVVRSVAEQCRALRIGSKAIPGVFELVGGQVTIGRLREVQIADLLRRTHARPAVDAHQYITGRTVLVTGAGGSIGQEICRKVADLQPGLLVMLGHGENSLFEARADLMRDFPNLVAMAVIADIRNEARMHRVFMALKPHVVFHAAAHKHVPLMEENPEEALTNNALGTRSVLRAALDAGTERLVDISTDKAASPVSVMGASKRLAEELVRQTAKRFDRAFMVVRFGNVLGSRGSVVPIFQRQIAQGQPLTITHPEMTRYFMTIPEAAHLVLEAGGLGRGGELFVLRMGEQIPIVDLAKDLIRLSGTTEEVPIVFTGVRPGEKLQETLWEDGAVVEPTKHPDIISVRERALGPEIDWGGAVERLSLLAAQGKREELLGELARYLPTFSRFEPGAVARV
jgi:FlaA1/EpsC-like NDP-sugar epimerase